MWPSIRCSIVWCLEKLVIHIKINSMKISRKPVAKVLMEPFLDYLMGVEVVDELVLTREILHEQAVVELQEKDTMNRR